MRAKGMRGVVHGVVLAVGMTVVAGAVPLTVAAGTPLAEVNGEAITAEEVDAALRGPLAKLEEQIYTLRRQRLEAMIDERLLAQEARRRGVSVQALLDAEVTPRVGLVTEQEIERAFRAMRGRVQGDEAQAREQLRARLQTQKLAAARQEFVRALRDKGNVTVHLQAPPVARVEVSTDGAPAKGPAGAPVTIVEFSDFHCPFCKRVLPTLEQLVARYGDRVQLVWRDYPIDRLHPAARRAHEAARCAHEQGKFWPYHDLLFEKAPRASAADLRAYAKEVGLDAEAFDACVESRKHAAAVEQDLVEGKRLGVTGTPAFFVNGRLVRGAQPLDAFVQIIEDELRRVAAKP